MSKHYESLSELIGNHAPMDTMYAYMLDLEALQAEATTARERALDEVDAELRDLKMYLHIMSNSDGLFMDFRARIDKLRTTPADPELARLEREVARAAVEATREAVDTDECGVYSKLGRISLTSGSERLARTAMIKHILDAKREGGAK